MEWISGIQRAIDYIESQLTDEIDFEEAAREAYSSSFHFQRVFSILCGFTLGEYVRMRRLSMAASDIVNTDEKVIEIAMKYGYDSPESFTRAFTRFHGVSPSEAKRGAMVKSFSRLSVKLTLTGGTTMDYRIEKVKDFKIICKKKQVTKPENATATADISAFWDECGKDGSITKICGYLPKEPRFKGLLGICFSFDTEANKFPYGIGVEYDGRPISDDSLEVVDIPESTFVVFECRGKMPECFTDTYKKIVTEFFPQNPCYEYGQGVELEVYPSDDMDNPNYYCEIWIAVNEK
ncbi:MAG: AraC family transcriptional regulator [Oscillospiraceae bacterium]|nr:AraC family transcriptional regulator [Oscillospiraceae bacterium]